MSFAKVTVSPWPSRILFGLVLCLHVVASSSWVLFDPRSWSVPSLFTKGEGGNHTDVYGNTTAVTCERIVSQEEQLVSMNHQLVQQNKTLTELSANVKTLNEQNALLIKELILTRTMVANLTSKASAWDVSLGIVMEQLFDGKGKFRWHTLKANVFGALHDFHSWTLYQVAALPGASGWLSICIYALVVMTKSAWFHEDTNSTTTAVVALDFGQRFLLWCTWIVQMAAVTLISVAYEKMASVPWFVASLLSLATVSCVILPSLRHTFSAFVSHPVANIAAIASAARAMCRSDDKQTKKNDDKNTTTKNTTASLPATVVLGETRTTEGVKDQTSTREIDVAEQRAIYWRSKQMKLREARATVAANEAQPGSWS